LLAASTPIIVSRFAKPLRGTHPLVIERLFGERVFARRIGRKHRRTVSAADASFDLTAPMQDRWRSF